MTTSTFPSIAPKKRSAEEKKVLKTKDETKEETQEKGEKKATKRQYLPFYGGGHAASLAHFAHSPYTYHGGMLELEY